jgi:hypothetical protein
MADLAEELTEKWTSAYPEYADLWDPVNTVWVIGEKSGLRVGVIPFMFTSAVIIGRLTVQSWYIDRWCYHDVPAAIAAARAWAGEYPATEPTGWHRHPTSGRRVAEDGTPYTEP